MSNTLTFFLDNYEITYTKLKDSWIYLIIYKKGTDYHQRVYSEMLD